MTVMVEWKWRLWLSRADDIEILDDWHVMGLKGSGSNSVMVKDVFVPEHRVSLGQARSKGYYMIEPLQSVPLYQTPFVPSLTLINRRPSVRTSTSCHGSSYGTSEKGWDR